jgi:hypothetical protein
MNFLFRTVIRGDLRIQFKQRTCVVSIVRAEVSAVLESNREMIREMMAGQRDMIREMMAGQHRERSPRRDGNQQLQQLMHLQQLNNLNSGGNMNNGGNPNNSRPNNGGNPGGAPRNQNKVCLDWMQGKCTGSSCPKNEKHEAKLEQLTFLNSRYKLKIANGKLVQLASDS